MKGQIQTSESYPCQGKLQKDLDFCIHPDVRGFLEVKPAYIRDKGFKSHV